MDKRTMKLGHKLGNKEAAAKLVAAGLDTPKKIKDASQSELVAALGEGGVGAVRAILPANKKA